MAGVLSLRRRRVAAAVGLGVMILFPVSCGPPRVRETRIVRFALPAGTAASSPDAPVAGNAVGASLRLTGRLYSVVFRGDYSDLLRLGEWRMRLDTGTPGGDDLEKPRTSCSCFAVQGDAPLVGRNFDNRKTDLIAVLCRPPRGHASIGFVPLRSLGFRPGEDLRALSGRRLLQLMNLPFLTCEGVNEKGVFAALNYVGGQGVSRVPPHPARFVTHWVREVLDGAGNLAEGIAIATSFHVYDNGRNWLSHDLFLADSSGRSAVVEYHDGQWRVIPAHGSWQVLTNFRQFPLSGERARRKRCWRYNRAAKRLEGGAGLPDAAEALDLLFRLSQSGSGRATQWSWVVDLAARRILLRLRGDGETLYRLEFP